MASPVARNVILPAPLKQWPIRLDEYDRSARLSPIEQRVLTDGLDQAIAREHKTKAVLDRLLGIERLCKPIDDALTAIDSNGRYDQRVKLMLLRQCGLHGSTFWEWDTTTWCRILGTTQQAFFEAHAPKPGCGGERQLLIAVAYLLRCFMDIPALGEVKRVVLAEKVFGVERVAGALQRVQAVTAGWGYRAHCKPLMSLVAELFLINQCPELELLTMELLESVRGRWQDSNYRSSLYFQLARVLAALGIIADKPQIRNRNNPELARQARITGIAPEWVVVVERWETTSTLTPRSRSHTRDAILKAGRWLQGVHPDITQPDQWTRELAADYVASVSRMKVGDYVSRTTAIADTFGKPLSARSRDFYLGAMRRFFVDLQEWEWTPRRFDPPRAFATPRSIKALIGPSPRSIADDLWAKLLWAGLNLTVADLPGHGSTARSHRGASGTTLRNGSYYPLEMIRALSLVWLFAGLRSDEIVRLRVGCARQEPSLQSSPDASACWLLDVPVHKTGTALTKPIDSVVGEAIVAWECVRPEQPMIDDRKTGELVNLLFMYRARGVPREYLNQRLIPLLCRKAGIPRSDARGTISSHRARSTIASQLFNARQPMSLFELQAWLGHRSPVTTQHYVAFTPTRLARAYTDAHYFQKNLRMMSVLIDREAIKCGASDEAWRYYDLGHGFCSYEFFDQCPHRMACARCDFYVPKESTRADLIASKTGMIHMLQEISLTDEERAAVDGDVTAVERLLKQLEEKPSPNQPDCGDGKKCCKSS
jgi:integrase